MKQRIVVDTSVIVSALIGPQGPNREILKLCLRGVYEPLISNALFQEYEDVSKRDNVVSLCPLTNEEILDLLKAFYSRCFWVPIYFLWRPNLRDEGDNFLIELAVAGNADCIVTNNIKDIKASELLFPDLQVLTPEAFLRGI